MKKAFVLVALWLCVLSGGVAAGTAEGVAYTIHFDRDTKETYPLQEQLQETYEQLMRGIQKDSRYTVLVHNLSLFESDDVQAKMEQDRLVLTQGDGRGASVSGTLADWSYCVAQVEPKSWLDSLFSGLW